MVLEAERRAELTHAKADDAHADLPVGHRAPDLLGPLGGLHAGRAQDLGVGGLGGARRAPLPGRRGGERTETDILQERST